MNPFSQSLPAHPEDPLNPSGGRSGAAEPAEARLADAGRLSRLPQLELDCMIALWRAPAAGLTAQQVQTALAARGRPLAHTTVLTVLQRLRQKGAVGAGRRGRIWRFSPLASRDQLRAAAVNRLIQNYFDGPEDLRRYLGLPIAGSDSAAPAAPAPSAADLDSSLL